jgi:hypothetical protein
MFIFYFLGPCLWGYLIGKHTTMQYPLSQTTEKFYMKGVSPQEIAKIEYEDEIEKFAYLSDMTNKPNYYDYIYAKGA